MGASCPVKDFAGKKKISFHKRIKDRSLLLEHLFVVERLLGSYESGLATDDHASARVRFAGWLSINSGPVVNVLSAERSASRSFALVLVRV